MIGYQQYVYMIKCTDHNEIATNFRKYELSVLVLGQPFNRD